MPIVTLRDLEYDRGTGEIFATWECEAVVPDDGSRGTPDDVAAAIRAERAALITARGRARLELDAGAGGQLPDPSLYVVEAGILRLRARA